MRNELNLEAIIDQARLGKDDSLNELVEQVQPKLRAFIFRITLDLELTSDLVQEVLMQMIKSLNNLRETKRFWPWLFQIAHHKIHDFYRKRQQASFSTIEDSLLERIIESGIDSGENKAVKRELIAKIMECVSSLKPRERAIVSLRCYEDMSYHEISNVVGGSEINTRMSFYKIKSKLKKQLSRYGFTRSSLGIALGLFGTVTLPGKSAAAGIHITDNMLKVINLRDLLHLNVRRKLVLKAVAAALIGSSLWYFWPASLSRAAVQSVHFVLQSEDNSPGALPSTSKGAYETWYYFSQGPDGIVMMRTQRWDPAMTYKMCSWLQNAEGNYYYYSGENVIYIDNYHLWLSGLGVRRLPTDTLDFIKFLDEVDGHVNNLEYRRDPKSGLIKNSIDSRFAALGNFSSDYQYNTIEESFFDYNWSKDIKVVDNRDEIHKQGWAYFQVDGKLNGKSVNGCGQIPFVYSEYEANPPWLKLTVDNVIQIADSPSGAYISDGNGQLLNSYPPETFLKGLPRPWEGLHTIDVIRRDAAEKRIYFKTNRLDDTNLVEVAIIKRKNYSQSEIVYKINLEKDWVESISFLDSGRLNGVLNFSYQKDIIEDYETPTVQTSQVTTASDIGIDWLFGLME